MLVSIHPVNPQERLIKSVVETLRNGGVIIYPTDTIYGLGCDIFQPEAVTRICRIKGIDPKKAHFSFICADLSHISDFVKSLDTPSFRLLKACLPGPYTFILKASRKVPKMIKAKKDTVGIRVPDHPIPLAMVRALGRPIMSVSLPMGDQVSYYTDPELMEEQFGNLTDMVIDGGAGSMVPSTVIDYTGTEPKLIREGAGDWSFINA